MDQNKNKSWILVAVGFSLVIGATGLSVMADRFGSCSTESDCITEEEALADELATTKAELLATQQAKTNAEATVKELEEKLATTEKELKLMRLVEKSRKEHDEQNRKPDSKLAGLTKIDLTINEMLTKPQVQGTIRKYNGRISACARGSNEGGLKGTIWVTMTIHEDGSVPNATIIEKSAKFRGTDVGDCIVKVVRGMEFPQAQRSLDISQYPFMLR